MSCHDRALTEVDQILQGTHQAPPHRESVVAKTDLFLGRLLENVLQLEFGVFDAMHIAIGTFVC